MNEGAPFRLWTENEQGITSIIAADYFSRGLMLLMLIQ
jgi:hypothetical protein